MTRGARLACAVELERTLDHDDLLGRRGGVFPGTVTLFVAASCRIPPNGSPIGPMSLEVSCMIDGAACDCACVRPGRGHSPLAPLLRGDLAWLVAALGALKRYVEGRDNR
jgi:hypothetical protein